MSQTSYDLVPYTNAAYPQTHISHLFTVGRLLNLSPPQLRKSRVLELGCGTGSNIVPMAAEYPEAEFLGIDLSDTQIRRGQDLIARTDLKNVVLRAQSIVDFPESAGQFDYIICHGVLSWIAPEVRAALLKVIRRHLSPDGLAVVSYNTLPGWAAIRSLREIMLYHTTIFASPGDKVAQARALLQFILDSQGNASNPYRAVVEQELNFLKAVQPNYFFHDHLEEHNQPFYLHEFAAMVAQEGLAYIGDTDIPSMFLGNYTPEVAKLLGGADDPVRIEQYLDFVNNRRFRSSVLTIAGKPIIRSIDAGRVEEFWLVTLIEPEHQLADGELDPNLDLRFKAPSGLGFTVRGAAGAALLATLAARRGQPMSVREVVAEAKQRYRLPQAEPELARVLSETALRLFLAGGLMLRADPGRHVATLSERPVALPVARAQAVDSDHVTNGFHQSVPVDTIRRIVLQALDGSRTKASLVDLLMTAIARGQLKIEQSGKPITDPAEIERAVSTQLDALLAAFSSSALLAG